MPVNVQGLLGAIGALPSVITKGLLGPLPSGQGLGLDPGQMQQAQQSALTDMAMGMVAGGRDPRTLMMARQNAQGNYRERMFDILKEQEIAKARAERDKVTARQEGLAALKPQGMENIWPYLSPQSQEQIVVDAATAKASNGPNSYEEFLRAGGSLIPDGPQRASAYDAWLMRKEKAGATNVSVNPTFPKEGATAAVAQVADAVTAAQGASDLISSANNVRAILDEGAITGFGASYRLDAARLANYAGLYDSGKQKIANTETLRAELANLAISVRSRMKGQGQISDYESKMIEQAIGRDPNMTEEGIRTILDLAERAGQQDIRSARNKVSILSATDPSLKAAEGMFAIPDPQQYKRNVTTDDGKKITVKLGVDGNYYWQDPATGKKYRWEE